MTYTAQYWIRRLKLRPHPEGGYYRETYRARRRIPPAAAGPLGRRSCCTAIYFLLRKPDFSAFHRLRSDELWHFHAGGAVLIHMLLPDGEYRQQTLGIEAGRGIAPQVTIPGGAWFAAELAGSAAYALLSCTVSPGFEFADFELGDRRMLCRRFARRQRLISRLTR